jgi:hypothetical protein
MRRVYGNWLIAVDDSFACGEERGGLVFRQSGRKVMVWRQRSETGASKAEIIRAIKAQANPRADTLRESDEGGIYRWVYKDPEEYEALSPYSYQLTCDLVFAREHLCVVVVQYASTDLITLPPV